MALILNICPKLELYRETYDGIIITEHPSTFCIIQVCTKIMFNIEYDTGDTYITIPCVE